MMKHFGLGVLLFGVVLLGLGMYNWNQLSITNATASATLGLLNGAGGSGGADYAASAQQTLNAVSNAYTQTVVIDLVLGVVFLLVGSYIMHVSEKRH